MNRSKNKLNSKKNWLLKPMPNTHEGSIWIELILLKLKTENWRHYSKIIFKRVNSTVGPIFNEKINKKLNLWVREQCIRTLFTEERSKIAAIVAWTVAACGKNAWKKKKKKKKKRRNATQQKRNAIQTLPKYQNKT